MKRNVEVGQTVWLYKIYDNDDKLTEHVVQKVGRKYFYCGVHGQYQVDLKTLRVEDQFGYRVYLSREDYDRAVRYGAKYSLIASRAEKLSRMKISEVPEGILDSILILLKACLEGNYDVL